VKRYTSQTTSRTTSQYSTLHLAACEGKQRARDEIRVRYTISTLFHAHQPHERLENFRAKRKSRLGSSWVLSSPVLTSTMVSSSRGPLHATQREETANTGKMRTVVRGEGKEVWPEDCRHMMTHGGSDTAATFRKHNETAW